MDIQKALTKAFPKGSLAGVDWYEDNELGIWLKDGWVFNGYGSGSRFLDQDEQRSLDQAGIKYLASLVIKQQ